MKCVELTGVKFGRLTMLTKEPSKNGRVRWLAKCDCGNECVVAGVSVRSGKTTSCGCAKRDGSRRPRGTGALSSEYTIWTSMKQRCQNPKHRAYRRYGGRGIVVCERWQTFENFLADMGPRPSMKHSIDRINNDKGYCLENCRWANAFEQARNSPLYRGGGIDQFDRAEVAETIMFLQRENTGLIARVRELEAVLCSSCVRELDWERNR